MDEKLEKSFHYEIALAKEVLDLDKNYPFIDLLHVLYEHFITTHTAHIKAKIREIFRTQIPPRDVRAAKFDTEGIMSIVLVIRMLLASDEVALILWEKCNYDKEIYKASEKQNNRELS